MKAIVTPKQDGIAKASKNWKAQERTINIREVIGFMDDFGQNLHEKYTF